MNNHPIQDGLVICCVIGFIINCYLEPRVLLGISICIAMFLLPYIVGLIYQKIIKIGV